MGVYHLSLNNMVAIVSQDTAHTRLQVLESRANEWRRVSIHGWMKFCITALEIKDLGLYKQTHSTWGAYVLETWEIKDTSKLRKDKMVLPYADILIEALPEITIEPTHLLPLHSAMRENGGASNPFMVETFQLGNRVSKSLSTKGTPALFRHCLAVLEEVEYTNGNPSYGGGNIPIVTNDTLEIIVLERMNEAKQRHISRLTPRAKITGVPHAIQDAKTGLWYAALPLASHAVIIGKQTTFYIDRGKGSE